MLTEAHIRRLASINSIEALLAFLRDELDWPLTSESVEDVTFTYEPEALGLKEEHWPKINAIYQVRRITTDQPWGIFYIDFENKRLPVTILRRILNHLRLKNKGRSGQWDAGDLLFMTTYGEEAEGMREVAFAHFHQQAGDLPTLNVLQWDAQDTPAKLRTTYDTLKGNLGWPPDTANSEGWREQWRSPFRHRIGHTIRTSKALAEKLAELSRDIRDRVKVVLDAESERGPMTKLYTAFKEALIHDLKPEDFADTFAQTVTYGLFSAAVSRRFPEEKGSKSLTTETIRDIVPETNPFLREVLATFLDVSGRKGGIDFDELGIQDVLELLRSDETDMRAILEDFGNRKHGEDPVIHFYEDYLKAYNKELKVKRGVFYTPQPVVSYIVRSVHELLQTEFGLEDGLASTITWREMVARGLPHKQESEQTRANPSQPAQSLTIPDGTDPDSHFVVILDPATGTATFLVEVIDVIYKHLRAKWDTDRAGCVALIQRHSTSNIPRSFEAFWNSYVPDHLLPRLYGYELMMAPYAIAHMKVGLKLAETGYTFGTDKRVRIYLTNALEPASELQARLALDWEALAHEAMAVKAVKETQRFTVVIGNPPYSVASSNDGEWIVELVKSTYYPNDETREQNPKVLLDDYVKFLRLAQHMVLESGIGTISMITNHGYFENATFRAMRGSIQRSFALVSLVDLHGNANKSEQSPDGTKDANVFDIQQGVGISTLCRTTSVRPCRISHSDLFGQREHKYNILSSAKPRLEPVSVNPIPPFFLFIPQDTTNLAEYLSYLSITEVMPVYSTGVKTHRDHFALAFSTSDLRQRIERFRDLSLSDEQIAQKYDLSDTRDWKLSASRQNMAARQDWESSFQNCLYRPFDFRASYHHEDVMELPKTQVMRHMIPAGNIAICVSRSVLGTDWKDVLATGCIVEFGILATRPGNSAPIFPLFLYGPPVVGSTTLFAEDAIQARAVNISERYLQAVKEHVGRVDADPVSILHFIYATLFAPSYRGRYGSFLKNDYPRIPIPGGPDVFDALVPLGADLVALHLMESPRLEQHMTTFISDGTPRVDKVSYSEMTVWIDKAQTVGFQGVPEEVWNFHIGGYQVCEKWLKDRGPKKGNPGRILTPDDISHYHKIVVALSETIRIMKEIDLAIDAHGGWPGAFQGAS